MKAYVVYASKYGNTEKVAKAIASVLPKSTTCRELSKAELSQLKPGDILIVGSPTQGGQPTTEMKHFVSKLPGLKGVKAATFDTRFAIPDQKLGIRVLMRTIGYAAEKLSRVLKGKGATLLAVEGFIVSDIEGPLRTGELERAKGWARDLAKG